MTERVGLLGLASLLVAAGVSLRAQVPACPETLTAKQK